MRDVAFLLAWVVMLPLVFQGAHLGVLLWAWTSLLAPNDVLYGLGTYVPFSKVAAIPALILLVLGRGGGIEFRPAGTVLILFGLVICGFVAQSATLVVNSGPGWDEYEKFLKIMLLCAMVVWVMRDRLRVHALLFAICLGLGFTAVGEAGKFLLSGGGHKVLGSSSTGDNNYIALNVLLIVPMLQYLHATARARLLRLACLAVGLMCVVCVIATGSRGGFAGLVVLAVGTVLTSRRRLLGLALIAVVAAIGFQLVSADYTARIATIETAADHDDSLLGRITAWKVATTIALDRPLTGSGFSGAQHSEVWLAYQDRIGWLDFIPSAPTSTLHAAHSIYFEILGDMGFPGLLLFLLLFASAWRNGSRVRRMVHRAKRADLAWAAALAVKLQLSLTIFLVCGGLLSAAYYDIEYLIVGLLTVLHGIVERALREAAATTGGGEVSDAPMIGAASSRRYVPAAS